MAETYITKAKQKQLEERMVRLGILDADLVEKFVLGSGKGGQKINKTASCVYIRHEPTGFELKCQKTRSRAANRFHARRKLCDRIEEQLLGEKSARQQKIEKIRRQKRRRTRRQKEKMLEQKHKTSNKKQLRRTVNMDD